MYNPYRSLLLALLPLLGCTSSSPTDDTGDSGETGDTGDSGETGDTADTADTGPRSEEGCYTVPLDTTECPDPSSVPPNEVLPATCGATVLTVDGPGTAANCGWIGGMTKTTWCIYPITVVPPENPCDYGRPLILGGAPRTAPLGTGDGWGRAATKTCPGDVSRAMSWARIGLAEHASIASFSRFALELLALGAPAELVMDAHSAAMDEVRHAQLAFGLAAQAGGVPLAPGPLALGELTVRGDLVALAVATVREGCIAETLSALQMALARDRATDPAERAALAVLVRDESRHAALAWRTVRWALQVGGEPVRSAVEAALAEVPSMPQAGGGLLPVDVAREAITRGWHEVVLPAGVALLASYGDQSPREGVTATA